MRRSLLVRLLVLSLAVACCAVAATAWLTTRTTSAALRGEFESTLDADMYIHQALQNYAARHDGWDGVASTIGKLAKATGRRITLTRPDGETIIDSARLTGHRTMPLPQTPAATVDALSGSSSSSVVSIAMEEQPDEIGVAGASFSYTAPVLEGPYWRSTKSERQARRSLVDQANRCLKRAGEDREVRLDPLGQPELVDTTSKGGADPVDNVDKPTGATRKCLPDTLYAASANARQLNRVEVRARASCLDRAGAEYRTTTNRHGLRSIVPPDSASPVLDSMDSTSPSDLYYVPAEPELTRPPTDGASPTDGTSEKSDDTEIWRDCRNQAREKALRPYVAPKADLYLGAEQRMGAFSAEGWWRTALVAFAVLVAAAAFTIFGGRQLVRPIRALTGAARRMEAGERGARVPVTGGDEIAQLGRAFNAMAETVETSEERRRGLVSDVAHELRTPLANVRGYLEAAEDGVVPLGPELVRSLREEAGLLDRLIDDLQTLALADAGMLRIHPEECDAAAMTASVIAANRSRAETAGVELVQDGPSEAVFEADPYRIRQALGNLIDNALRHSSDGGRVTVRLGESVEDDVVWWTVADTGSGIEAEHLPHVFERFYRADPSRSRVTGGTGLGLAITKHLVEAHEGTVTVTSTVGEGTTFTLSMPRRRTEAGWAG